MDQQFINWLMGAFGALLGFLLKTVWDAVKDLQVADKELADKVKAIEILVAGEYVKKTELEHIINRVLNQLDRIEAKLDTKADK